MKRSHDLTKRFNCKNQQRYPPSIFIQPLLLVDTIGDVFQYLWIATVKCQLSKLIHDIIIQSTKFGYKFSLMYTDLECYILINGIIFVYQE